ncbi:MAG: hypothetical protein IJV48_08405 [Ruminococcus sp.]|nr:hypothetical protein [Ruminococcus sp.]
MNDMLHQKYSKQGKESFVLGITGLLLHLLALIFTNRLLWFELVALIAGISGLILGIISRKRLKENNRLGLAGVILSIITLILFLLAILLISIALYRISDVFSVIASNPW